MLNLSNYARDRQIIGYDLGIKRMLKPSKISNSLKRLMGCPLWREF